MLGNEILDGTKPDEIGYLIGKDLAKEGIVPARMSVILEEDLKAEIESILSTERFDSLIIVCNFRPQKDDKILDLISTAIGRQLLPDKELFEATGKNLLTRSEKKTPTLPDDAAIKSPNGTVQGFKIMIRHCKIYVLPKKIAELRLTLRNSVIPELRN